MLVKGTLMKSVVFFPAKQQGYSRERGIFLVRACDASSVVSFLVMNKYGCSVEKGSGLGVVIGSSYHGVCVCVRARLYPYEENNILTRPK